MPIDLSQFHQTFIEEALEILSEMEQILLQFNLAAQDKEKINSLFRAMHTIKGNSATFGFTPISEFAHVIESLLDKSRYGSYILKKTNIDFLLQTVDCIRNMITDVQNKRPIDTSRSIVLKKELENLLTDTSLQNQIKEEESSGENWKISFHPSLDFLQVGSEPYFLFRSLEEHGDIEVKASPSKIPEFEVLQPELCYLSWQVILKNSTIKSRAEIEEIFEWISDKSELEISPLVEIESPSQTVETVEEEEKNRVILKELSTIRVSVDKIDALINIVGELVITQLILEQECKILDARYCQNLLEGVVKLNQNCRELQESVMRIRMVPISFAFNRFHRVVRDLAAKMGKEVELRVMGEQTELDKTMMEKLVDPLMHLIRNAIDHGMETPDVRIAKGKSSVGLIELIAYQEGGNIGIVVRDDGSGLNKEKIKNKAKTMQEFSEQEELTDEKLQELIFKPGFSTAETTTDISGRGVGLDVVYKNIDALHGTISVKSNEPGTAFTITLPLTLAIMDCQLFMLDNQIYIIPLVSITEIIKIEEENIHHLGEATELYFLRGVYIPVVHVKKLFSKNNKFIEKSNITNISNKFLIVVTLNNRLFGLVVDDILSQQQVVIKSLEENYQKIPGISGATVLGDGSVALIVDIEGIIALEHGHHKEGVQKISDDKVNTKLSYPITDDTQLLIFKMCNSEYGVDMLNVVEIGTLSQVTPLPGTPDYIKGVINLRGLVIPVIDLCERFELMKQDDKLIKADSSIIVLRLMQHNREAIVSVLADSVTDTCYIKNCKLEKAPEQETSSLGKFISGLVTIDHRMVTILEVNSMDF